MENYDFEKLMNVDLKGHVSYEKNICERMNWYHCKTVKNSNNCYDAITDKGEKVEFKKSLQIQLDKLFMAAESNVLYLFLKNKKYCFVSAKKLIDNLKLNQDEIKEIIEFRKKYHRNRLKAHIVLNIVYPNKLLKWKKIKLWKEIWKK